MIRLAEIEIQIGFFCVWLFCLFFPPYHCLSSFSLCLCLLHLPFSFFLSVRRSPFSLSLCLSSLSVSFCLWLSLFRFCFSLVVCGLCYCTFLFQTILKLEMFLFYPSLLMHNTHIHTKTTLGAILVKAQMKRHNNAVFFHCLIN